MKTKDKLSTEKFLYETDEQIIDMYWIRDERAIAATDKKYGKYLLACANRYLNDMSESEESVNDAYYDAWCAIPPTRPKVLKAFLLKIIRCISIERYRRKSREKRIPSNCLLSLSDFEDYEFISHDIERELYAKEISEHINDYLKSTSQRKRFIFVARYYMSYSINEIIKVLRVSESTINKEIHIIKDELKEILSRKGYLS